MSIFLNYSLTDYSFTSIVLEDTHVHYTYFIVIKFVDCVCIREIEIPENLN